MKSVVIDSNIFVSALLGSENCNKIYDALKLDKFEMFICDELLGEIVFVLHKPKFEFNKLIIDKLVWYINKKAKKVVLQEKTESCRDPKDNMVLECAIAGNVDYIVTGDKDLLEIKSFHNIKIITPQSFLKTI